jgi:acyl-CoA-binding protein
MSTMTTPSDLQADFENARAATGQWTERPDNASLLKLYALYKQGSLGDNDQPRPGFSDPVARAKWEAWNGLKGLSRQDAMTQYIALVDSLS